MGEWAFNMAHIPGSINISSMEQGEGLISPDDEIVVYCSNEFSAHSLGTHDTDPDALGAAHLLGEEYKQETNSDPGFILDHASFRYRYGRHPGNLIHAHGLHGVVSHLS